MLAVLFNWGTGIDRKIFLWLRNDNFLFSKNKLCMHNPYNKIILKQKSDPKKEVHYDLRVLYSTQNNTYISK